MDQIYVESTLKEIQKLTYEINEKQMALLHLRERFFTEFELEKYREALVGKHYKIKSWYGHSEIEDYWYIYRKITEITDEGIMKITDVEQDMNGKTTYQEIRSKCKYTIMDNWIEITKEEYKEKTVSIISKILHKVMSL